MISITVNDPNKSDARILRAIADALDGDTSDRVQHWDKLKADLFAFMGGIKSEPAGYDVTTMGTNGELGKTRVAASVTGKVVDHAIVDKIAADDNPAAGAATLCGECLLPQFETPSGITCPNGHGGAGPATVLTCETADPAALFAAGAPPLPTTAGAPPLPNVLSPTPTPPPSPPPSSQTSTQPLTGAATDSPATPPPPAPAPDAALVGAATTTGVLTDSAGMLWDARIHASTKATIQDGTWKKRRGVEPAVVAEVEAQLRTAAAIPVPARLAPAAGWPFPTGNPHAGAPPAPTFGSMMVFITERIQSKALTQEQVTAVVQSLGLQSINLVMSRTDLIPAIMDALRAIAP